MNTDGIGVVFNIDDLGGGFYGDRAWRLFMRTLEPGTLADCTLREGDTNETLRGSRREFCIAVLGPRVNADLVKKAFANCSDEGLAPIDRRFIEGPRLTSEPLVDAGLIDPQGRLVQDEWSRVVHDQCRDSGWGFAPKSTPNELSPDLTAELRELRTRTLTGGAGQNPIPLSTSPGASRRAWWKSWAK